MPTSLPRLCAALAGLLLGGCASLSGAPPAANDSMRSECSWDAPYAAVAAPSASLAQLQAIAAARLAVLQLTPVWSLGEGAGQAQSFDDSPADRERLQRLLATVLPALERYPSRLLQQVQLRKVVLVKELAVDGQRRLAMPEPETDSVVYADNNVPSLCPAGMELRTHHEFYHFIEYRLFHDFYYRDPVWMAFNPAEVQYGAGGATAYGKPFQNLGHPQPGLVSMYAAYGPEEDKAEMFGWMMTPVYAARLNAWLPQDAALAGKQRFMQELLRGRGALENVALGATAPTP